MTRLYQGMLFRRHLVKLGFVGHSFREGSRLDMCFVGVFIGGEFTPSSEVSDYGFFSQDSMPLLRSNQVFLIDEALKQKKPKKINAF